MKNLNPILMALCALWLLIGCSADKGQMIKLLEELEQMNRADSVMRNDSLAEDLVAYFDKNGSSNERMRAYYMLGRTYADLGEAPKAIAAYQNAEGCADTTHDDCDFKTLSRIHGQKAGIFRKQYMAQEAVKEFDKAIKYSLAANDSLSTLRFIENRAIAYYQLGLYDSLLISTDIVFNGYKLRGLYELAANSIGASIRILLQRNDVKKAKRYIDFYEQNCDLKKDPANKKAALYTYLGSYHLCSGSPDSAVFYFKKQLEYKELLNNRVQGYHGLFMAYQQMNQKDSMAKYADLYCIVNDSSNVFESANRLQRIQASYNYDHQKHLAEQNEERAQRLLWLLTGLVVLVVLLSLIAYQFFDSNKKRREAEVQQYKNSLEALEKLQVELQEICSEEPLSPSELFEKKHDEIVELLSRIKEYKRKDKKNMESLEDRLTNALIVRHLKELADSNPYQKASYKDMKDLRNLINEEIPQFYTSLNTAKYTLTPIEYEVSMMVRVHLSPSDIWKLAGISKGYASNLRSRLLLKIYGIEGSPKDYDQKVLAIR